VDQTDWDRRVADAWASFDERDEAVMAFLALALADSGREREAVSLTLAALAPHLPEYQKTVANYARLLAEAESAGPSPHAS
jgi:hypothetical protein